jgi:multicomponent K+:H+ antiporter subunit G
MDFDSIHWSWQLVIASLLLIGGVFTLVGVIGMLRFPDFYMRLHAPTKASTLGVGGVLLASIAYHIVQGSLMPHELLITLFVFITAPVSASLLAKAALHLRAPSKAPVPPDQPLP